MRRRRSVLRVFAGRLGIAGIIATTVMAGSVVAVNTVIDAKLDNLDRVDVNTSAGPAQGGNFLLIGSDSRAFVDDPLEAKGFGSDRENGGQRSDTMMVIHVEPDASRTVIVSFPRDLWVTIPGQSGKQKINAAFNSGGPDKVIQTLRSNFGLEINHYLEVDFESFRSVVNAIGHVPVYVPYPARDEFTGLFVPFPGCVRLDGDASLAYARSRHLEYWNSSRQRWTSADETADLGRIARQQDFIRRLASLAVQRGLDDPLKANDLADRVIQYLKVDSGLGKDDLLSLVDAFRSIDPADPNALGFEVFPFTDVGPLINGQSGLYPKDPDWRKVSERLNTFGGPAPAATPTTSSVEPTTVTVKVLNGSGRAGIAATVLDQLGSLGFRKGAAENDPRGSLAASEVRFKPGARDKALAVASRVNPSPKLVEDAQLADADVALVIGTDFLSIPAATASGSSGGDAEPSGQSASTTAGATTVTTAAPSERQFGTPVAKTAPC